MEAKDCQRVVFNISGEIFETTEGTLRRFPNTLLGHLQKRTPYYCHEKKQYFFNRSRRCFEAILFFYQSNGRLSCPPGMSLEMFQEESEFFEIPNTFIKKMKEESGIILELQTEKTKPKSNGTLKAKIWNLCENPETSQGARSFMIVSMTAIVLSIAASCLETVPSLNPSPRSASVNPWRVVEVILNAWFLVELVLRFSSAPKKLRFLKSSLNWVDIVLVVPYFFTLAITPDNVRQMDFLRIFRLGRVLRLFRVSKHSTRLRVAGYICKSSFEDLKLLVMCLFLMIFFFGSTVYYVENFNGLSPQFMCMPDGLWWAVMTLTNVGYGDIIPATVSGRIFAASFMFIGVITMSLPILSLVAKFSQYYDINVNADKQLEASKPVMTLDVQGNKKKMF